MIEQTVKEIREYGVERVSSLVNKLSFSTRFIPKLRLLTPSRVESFCELLNLAAPDVRMSILGILAASIGLDLKFKIGEVRLN